jgi:N-acetylglucosamine kinase
LFPDLVIAWAGGLALQPGVVLVAGTGSVAYGRNAAGEAARAGGWGYLAGDEGSAYWIGRAALAALARALDGRTDPTVLADSLPRRFPNGCAASEEWLRAIYRERWSPGQVAALAPVVSEAAEQGDTAAGAILAAAGQQLAGLAGHVLRKLRLAETDAGVVGAGGLLEVKGLVRDTVAADLRREAPRATLRPARLPPVAGAVLLALAHRGAAIGEDTVARMAG